jgi:NADH-quinone oxidoreductase subunit C
VTVALTLVQEFLAEKLGEAALSAARYRDEATILVRPDALLEALAAAKEPPWDFAMLVDLTAWDRVPAEPRFEIVYNLLSLSRRERLRLRVQVEASNPALPTANSLFACADWFEREIWDLFGVRFEGHPDLTRILLPDDWEGHPLRRDFELGDEPVEFEGHVPKRPSEIIPHVPPRRKDR